MDITDRFVFSQFVLFLLLKEECIWIVMGKWEILCTNTYDIFVKKKREWYFHNRAVTTFLYQNYLGSGKNTCGS